MGRHAIRIILTWALLGLTTGCQKRQQASDDQTTAAQPSEETRTGSADLPHVRRGKDLEARDDERVVVEGTYEQVDVRKRKQDASELVYRGHAVVRLDGGRAVYLEPIWADAAVRPDDEIEQLEGEQVRAVGKLHERCPGPDEPAATIIAPCLHPVGSVTAK